MFSVVALEQQGPGFKSFFLVEFDHLVLVWVLSAASVFLPQPSDVKLIGCECDRLSVFFLSCEIYLQHFQV